MATTRVRRRGDIAATPTWARWRRRGRCGGRSTRRYVGACMNSMAGAVAPTSSFAGADTSPSRAGCTCPRARAQRSSFSPGVSLRSTPGYLHAPLPGCWVSACERSPCSAFGYPRPNTVIPREPFDVPAERAARGESAGTNTADCRTDNAIAQGKPQRVSFSRRTTFRTADTWDYKRNTDDLCQNEHPWSYITWRASPGWSLRNIQP